MMPIAPTPNPSLARALGDPALTVPSIQGRSLADQLQRVPQFRLATNEEGAFVAIPETSAAARMLGGDRGAAVTDALAGIARARDALRPGSPVTTIQLPRTAAETRLSSALAKIGSFATSLLAFVDREGSPDPEFITRSLATVGHQVGTALRSRDPIDAAGSITDVAAGTTMMLAPKVTTALLQARAAGPAGDARIGAKRISAAGYVSRIITHELLHDTHGFPTNTGPWEEGITETLARWPGRTDIAARALGVSSSSQHPWAYEAPTSATREVLRLAGIDPHRRSDFEAATALLRSGAVSRRPGRIARQIMEHLALPKSEYDGLRTSIRDLMGSPDPAAQARALGKRLKRASTDVR